MITMGAEIIGDELAKNNKGFVNGNTICGRHQIRVDMLNKMLMRGEFKELLVVITLHNRNSFRFFEIKKGYEVPDPMADLLHVPTINLW